MGWLFTCTGCNHRFDKDTDQPIRRHVCPDCGASADLGWAYEFWEAWLQKLFPEYAS
jgi:hypothetical protein